MFTVLGLVLTGWAMNEPLPHGEPGPDADALARQVQAAIGLDAWEQTGAVSWTFAGSHHHLFDRERELAQVHWGDYLVLIHAYEGTGVVVQDGGDSDHAALIDRAHAYFINDSFWLNPFPKFFDEGVTRAVVDVDGEQALLVQFASGGRTPGDAYLWLLDEDHRPRAWRMWVGMIPIGGVETSWEGWQTLSTGMQVSTMHTFGPVGLELTDVRGATTLSELVPGDPFTALLSP